VDEGGQVRALVRAALLILMAVILQHCGPVQGCSDIPQRSRGPCGDVGLPTDWYYDDAWRTQ
jgi:hypothetical protein